MRKTTVNLDDKVFMLVRSRARREAKPMGQLINEILADAFADAYGQPKSIASFDSGIDDLGVNAEKYLRERAR